MKLFANCFACFSGKVSNIYLINDENVCGFKAFLVIIFYFMLLIGTFNPYTRYLTRLLL